MYTSIEGISQITKFPIIVSVTNLQKVLMLIIGNDYCSFLFVKLLHRVSSDSASVACRTLKINVSLRSCAR